MGRGALTSAAASQRDTTPQKNEAVFAIFLAQISTPDLTLSLQQPAAPIFLCAGDRAREALHDLARQHQPINQLDGHCARGKYVIIIGKIIRIAIYTSMNNFIYNV